MSEPVAQFGLVEQVSASFRRRRSWSGLRMTPMIDVVFLLLTFFVLTAQFAPPEKALPLIFGASASTSPQSPAALNIAVMPDAAGCRVTLNSGEEIVIPHDDPAVGLAALAEQMRQTVQPNLQTPVRLYCDDAVLWDLVTKIYDLIYGLGARDIAFVVESLD